MDRRTIPTEERTVSYWVSFVSDDEKYEFWSNNHTSNVAPMWTRALGAPLHEVIKSTPDLTKLSLRLAIAVFYMEKNPDVFKDMEPTNGWGNYQGALKFLKDILNMTYIFRGAAGVKVRVSH
jgi:hypothetical protein